MFSKFMYMFVGVTTELTLPNVCKKNPEEDIPIHEEPGRRRGYYRPISEMKNSQEDRVND